MKRKLSSVPTFFCVLTVLQLSWWKPFTPFEPSLWLAIIVALLAVVCLLWVFEGAKVCKYDYPCTPYLPHITYWVKLYEAVLCRTFAYFHTTLILFEFFILFFPQFGPLLVQKCFIPFRSRCVCFLVQCSGDRACRAPPSPAKLSLRSMQWYKQPILMLHGPRTLRWCNLLYIR